MRSSMSVHFSGHEFFKVVGLSTSDISGRSGLFCMVAVLVAIKSLDEEEVQRGVFQQGFLRGQGGNLHRV